MLILLLKLVWLRYVEVLSSGASVGGILRLILDLEVASPSARVAIRHNILLLALEPKADLYG